MRCAKHFFPALVLTALGCAEVVVDEPASHLDDGSGASGGVAALPATPTPVPTAAAGTSSSLPPMTVPNQTPIGSGAPAGSNPPRPLPAPAGTPPAVPGAPGALLLLDDFEDGDASGWIADAEDGDDLVGNWAVVETEEGRAFAQLDASFDDDSWAVGGDLTWTNVNLEVRCRFTSVSNVEDAVVMLALRFQSKENYYYAEFRGDGSVKVRKRVDGSEPELSSEELERPAVVGQWMTLGFSVRGTSLEARLDGVVIGSAVVDTELASGGIALGVKESAAVEFDDVRVTVP
jgi:hypothetical protein